MTTVEDLQRQIAELQKSMTATAPVAQPMYTQDDLKRAVKEAVAELSSTANVVTPEPIQVEQPKIVKSLTIMEAIGCSLSEEEQIYFSDLKNLEGLRVYLPDFLLTDIGSSFIKELAKGYKEYHENKA